MTHDSPPLGVTVERNSNDIEAIYELLADVNRHLSAHDARFDAVDARFDAVDARFDGVDARFDAVDARFDGVDARLDTVDTHLAEILKILTDDRAE